MSPEYQSLRYQAYGVLLDIETPAELASEVEAVLPPIARGLRDIIGPPHFPVTRSYRLESSGLSEWQLLPRGERPITAAVPLPDALDALRSDAELWVAATTTAVGFVHAGVVAFGDFGIVLPGRTHAGKTTLVAALLKAGAIYYSDDYAVLDPTGKVWPFPKSLSVRVPGGTRRPTHPEELGAPLGEKGIPVGLVLQTAFRPDVTFVPQPISSGEIALALLENAPAATIHPGKLLPILSAVASQAKGYRGDRGEADEVVEFLIARSSAG